MTLDEKVKQYCPMEGTLYEGFCIENFATIVVKTAECDHKKHCEKVKKQLDKEHANQ